MKKPIEFRAWDGTQMIHMPLDTNFGLHRFFGALSEDAIVEQFTGKLAKGGVKIFEGDILDYGANKDMIVIWSPQFASFGLRKAGWAFTHFFGEAISNSAECEVVGNIHEVKNQGGSPERSVAPDSK